MKEGEPGESGGPEDGVLLCLLARCGRRRRDALERHGFLRSEGAEGGGAEEGVALDDEVCGPKTRRVGRVVSSAAHRVGARRRKDGPPKYL